MATVAPHVLPSLVWTPTEARGERHGQPVELVVVHRWGVRFTTERAEQASYRGVVSWFEDTSHRASAHVVYPGSAQPGEATQMVRWSEYAWAEAAYNPVAVEVESADAIWLGHDDAGLAQLARIVGFLLTTWKLPPLWSHRRGFCRHADLGLAGGGHTACPTTDIALWRHFVRLVQAEHARGGYRHTWGRF